MAVTTAKSLREKTTQELQDHLLLEKKRLFDGVVKNASGEAIKPHEKREGRRLIARIQCVLRERQLRVGLDKQIADLAPKAKDAAPRCAKVIKTVEQRAAEIRAALEKPPAEDRSRQVKPMIQRVRYKDIRLSAGQPLSASDRAAIQLAEAKRRRASLERTDIGQ
jgi:ribosomal protein L29